MNSKRLTTLALVTVAVVSGAGLALRNRGHAPERAEGFLLADLHERLNDAASLTFTRDDWTIEARLEQPAGGEARWVLSERGNYPIDFEKLRKAVVSASNLELREAMTARPEHHAKLGVDAAAPHLIVRDAGGAILADVYLGERKGADGLYARCADTDQSWLVRGRVDLPMRELAWVDTQVLQLDTDRVVAVELTHPDGELLSVEKVEGEAQPWRVNNVPEGREQAPAGAASGLGAALAWVSFEDVAPADSVDFSSATRARFTTEDGLVVLADLAQRDDGAWLRLSAEAIEVVGPVPAEPDSSGEVGEAENAEESVDGDGAADEAAELNAKHGPWAYRVADFKAQSLTKRLEDLLVPLPPEITGVPEIPNTQEDPGPSPAAETPEADDESDDSTFVYDLFGDSDG